MYMNDLPSASFFALNYVHVSPALSRVPSYVAGTRGNRIYLHEKYMYQYRFLYRFRAL